VSEHDPVRSRLLVAILAGTLGLGACSSSASHASSPPLSTTTTPPSTSTTAATSTTVGAGTCRRPHAPGQFSQSFAFQGVPRTYQLYVPRAYDGTKNVPVVFNFHGYGSNAVQQMVYGNFKPEADRDDFLIVAPDGQVPQDRHFNMTNEPGLQNDVAMAEALLDHIESTLCVDTRRVYSTGMSDGGAMTSTLACLAFDRFAAFGAVAVIADRAGCGDNHPIAITAFSGTADPVVPFNGGTVHCCGGTAIGSAPAAMAAWAAHNHCNPAYHDERVGTEVRKRTWTGCEAGSETVFYIIDGGGHTWPGSIPIPSLGKTTRQIDASATIWKFFQAHTLQP